MKKTLFFVLFLSVIPGRMVPAQEIREYVVRKTGTPLVIDGVMDEAVWEKTTTTEYFVEQGHGDSVPHPTRAFLTATGPPWTKTPISATKLQEIREDP